MITVRLPPPVLRRRGDQRFDQPHSSSVKSLGYRKLAAVVTGAVFARPRIGYPFTWRLSSLATAYISEVWSVMILSGYSLLWG